MEAVAVPLGSSPPSGGSLINRLMISCRTRSPERVSLVHLCRSVIVANLERYPPSAFRVCSEEEFEAIIRLRHENTRPKEGTGGLDGTGRVAPAISDRFIKEVEDSIPHLANSNVVDELVWKDCVEYRFRRGGLTRPKALELPWPLLLDRFVFAANSLQERLDSELLECLGDLPVSVSVLAATGVGKLVKKALKNHQGDSSNTEQYERLAKILNEWKEVAQNGGVSVAGSRPKASSNQSSDNVKDLELAESCVDWRQLFAVLKRREDERRSSQGKRMRDRRKHLASDRPKIVKVRPTKAKHERMLTRPDERKAHASINSKISKLKHESAIVAMRQRQPAPTKPIFPTKKTSSFGAAVAFASGPKRSSSNKPGGRTMQIASNAGGASRGFGVKR